MIRPKITIVSGMTTSGRTRPNSSGFSAIAPTDAAPITFSAQAVASPVPATVNAIAMPISPCASAGAGIVLHLRFHSLTEGLKRRPSPSEELDEELDVVQTNRLDDRGHGSKEENDEVEDEGDDSSNEDADDEGNCIPGIE